MVQKQKDRDKSLSDSVSDKISTGKTSSYSKSSSTSSRLKNALMNESSAEGSAIAGVTTGMIGLIVAGILPTTIIPMIVGFAIGGGVLSKLIPDDVFSVMTGVGITSFVLLFLTVSLPFGLGFVVAPLLALVSTGLAVATYEKFSDSSY